MKYNIEYRANGYVDGKKVAPILAKILKENPKWTTRQLYEEIGLSKDTVISILKRYKHIIEKPKTKKITRLKSTSNLTAEPVKAHKTCQYISGNICDDNHKCGKPSLKGKSWCEEHYAVVFKKVDRSEDDG